MPAGEHIALLRARDLTAVLQGDSGPVTVLDAVSFEVAAGEIVDIVGPSGSGKSTFLRALARLLPGVSGGLWIGSDSADTVAPQEWRSLVTLLPQRVSVVSGTLHDNLELPWRFKVRSKAARPTESDTQHALEAVGLGGVDPGRDAARLSVGQQARLAFARVWLSSPRVLLLDEADAALDDESAALLGDAVRRFAADGGRLAESTGPAAVVRVRHRADDGLAARRLRLADGHLVEVRA